MEIFRVTFQPLLLFVGLLIGIYQYYRQQKFKRLQNLSALWRGFTENSDLLPLFNLMDEIENGDNSRSDELKSYNRQVKLRYLALIEEVSLYVTEFEVDKAYAKYLFQWHLYFPYISKKTAIDFWDNLGGMQEMNASYWQKSRSLATEFAPEKI